MTTAASIALGAGQYGFKRKDFILDSVDTISSPQRSLHFCFFEKKIRDFPELREYAIDLLLL